VGLEPTEGWWNRSVTDFEDQVAHFCPGCGVPAKQVAFKDFMDADIYTDSNAAHRHQESQAHGVLPHAARED